MKKINLTQESFLYKVVLGVLLVAILAVDMLTAAHLLVIGTKDIIEDRTLNLNFSDGKLYAAALFFIIALSRGIQAVALRRTDRWLALKHLVYCGLTLIASVVLIVAGDDKIGWRIAGMLYLAAAVFSRVIAFLHTRKKAGLLLILPLLAALLYPKIAMGSSLVLIFIHSVINIVSMAFSRIRADILVDILRKTYAAEILFGLLLLITAFSIILPVAEPEVIGSFKNAMWYCFAIVTTIGFGDISATTDFGRILSVILGVYGIIVVALITSIIVNFYGEMKRATSSETKEVEDHGKE